MITNPITVLFETTHDIIWFLLFTLIFCFISYFLGWNKRDQELGSKDE